MPSELVESLTHDLRKAATSLGREEARYLVDLYYSLQDHRLRTSNQARALGEGNEPNDVFVHFLDQLHKLESQAKTALDKWTDTQELGKWAKMQVGIGPVIAAGLLAHIEPLKFATAGKVWKYSGLAPGQRRIRGQKLNYNPMLKTLAWKIGDSFVKQSGRENAFYGKLYRDRKAYEEAKNEQLDYKDQAEESLATKKIGKDTDAYAAYSKGKLPPARIDTRARRWATKIFLAHFWEVGWRIEGQVPPKPFPIEHLGHVDVIKPPHAEDFVTV